MARPVKPGPIVIPQCAEVKVFWSDGEFEWTNVWHGSTGGATSVNAALADTLLTGFKNALTTSGFGGNLVVATSLARVEVKDLSTAGQPAYLSSGGAQAGSDASSPLPVNTAICVSLLTQRSGAQWRGRTYLAGLGASVSNDNRHHTQIAGTNATAFVDACIAAMATAQLPMVIAQRELLAGTDSHGNSLPPRSASTVGVTGTKITSNRLDTQRRRLGRR